MDTDEFGKVFIIACKSGYDKVARLLLENNVDVDTCNKNCYTVLMYASLREHVEVVKLLLEYEVNVNKSTIFYHNTALMIASRNGNVEIVKLLLEHDVDVNKLDRDGDTALVYAILNEHVKVVQLLLEYGADVNTVNSDCISPLCYAKKSKCEEIKNLLLDHEKNNEVNEVSEVL